MARPVRGCLTPQPQQGGTKEPETNTSVPQQEEQIDASEGKDIDDYDAHLDNKPEGLAPEIKAVDEDKENSDTEYAKIELPHDEILHQRKMNCKVAEKIKRVYQA